MSILVFQHDACEDAANLGWALQQDGHRLQVVKLYAGHSVPLDLDDVDGLVIMGGPMNVDQADQYPWLEDEAACLKRTHEAGKPMVGICLGAQLIGKVLGGQVAAMPQPEVGWHPVKLVFPGTIDPILAGIRWNSVQFHMHGQEVTQLPPGATPLAGSAQCRNQAFRVGLTTYAFQYHFEWNRQEIARMCQDGLAARAGVSAEQILAQAEQHYPGYAHLGQRLCRNLAMLLFPIDKR